MHLHYSYYSINSRLMGVVWYNYLRELYVYVGLENYKKILKYFFGLNVKKIKGWL